MSHKLLDRALIAATYVWQITKIMLSVPGGAVGQHSFTNPLPNNPHKIKILFSTIEDHYEV